MVIAGPARIFHEAAKRFSLPLQIHSIDLPEGVEHVEHPHSQRGLLVRGIPNVHLHLGDGLDTALGLCRTLPAGSRTLFFCDGDHEYGSVRRELAADRDQDRVAGDGVGLLSTPSPRLRGAGLGVTHSLSTINRVP